MKYLKPLFHAVTAQKAPSQICSFDAKEGWNQVNSPLSALLGLQPRTPDEITAELRKTHESFWGSCECGCSDGLILYRPRDAGRREWLAYINGRGASELVLLSNFSSAMEFIRLYAPSLMSIPDHHRVPDLLEEMLDCLSNLEGIKHPDK